MKDPLQVETDPMSYDAPRKSLRGTDAEDWTVAGSKVANERLGQRPEDSETNYVSLRIVRNF